MTCKRLHVAAIAATIMFIIYSGCSSASGMLQRAGVPGPLADIAVGAAKDLVYGQVADLLRQAGLKRPENIIKAVELAAQKRYEEAAATAAGVLADEALTPQQRNDLRDILAVVDETAKLALGAQNEVTVVTTTLRNVLAESAEADRFAIGASTSPSTSPAGAIATQPSGGRPSQSAAVTSHSTTDASRTGTAQASGDFQPNLLVNRLIASKVFGVDSLVAAVAAFRSGRTDESVLQLKAALLANGYPDTYSGRRLGQLLLASVSDLPLETGHTVRLFVDQHFFPSALYGNQSGGALSSAYADGLLTKADYQQMRVARPPKEIGTGTGFLFIEVNPPHATVSALGREYSGPQVSIENVPCGYLQVDARADGYAPQALYAVIEPFKVTRAKLGLAAEPSALTILSNPAGATVVIDGIVVGTSPITIDGLPLGPHHVSIRRGGIAWEGTIDILGGTKVIRPNLTDEGAAAQVLASAPLPGATLRDDQRLSSTSTSVKPSSTMVPLTSLSADLKASVLLRYIGARTRVQLASGDVVDVVVQSVSSPHATLQPDGGPARMVPLDHLVAISVSP